MRPLPPTRDNASYRSDKILVAPTPEVVAVADLLDSAIGRVLKNLGRATSIGKYEADTQARLLLWLILRNVEGVTVLARRDLTLLPSAIVAARSAFEAAVRVLWMLEPNDKYEREARWLTFLKGEQDYLTKVAVGLEDATGNSYGLRDTAATYQRFRVGIEQKLPKRIKSLKQMPKLLEMLKSLGREHLYVFYRQFSEYVHGGYEAAAHYGERADNGVMLYREKVKPSDWWNPLSACAFSVLSVGDRHSLLLNVNPNVHVPATFRRELDEALDKLRDAQASGDSQ